MDAARVTQYNGMSPSHSQMSLSLQSPALGARTGKKGVFDFGETPKGDMTTPKAFGITPQGLMPEIKFDEKEGGQGLMTTKGKVPSLDFSKILTPTNQAIKMPEFAKKEEKGKYEITGIEQIKETDNEHVNVEEEIMKPTKGGHHRRNSSSKQGTTPKSGILSSGKVSLSKRNRLSMNPLGDGSGDEPKELPNEEFEDFIDRYDMDMCADDEVMPSLDDALDMPFDINNYTTIEQRFANLNMQTR